MFATDGTTETDVKRTSRVVPIMSMTKEDAFTEGILIACTFFLT